MKNGKVNIKIPEVGYAFIDGSYNHATQVYGYGGFLVDAIGIKHILQGFGSEPDMAKMRNVAGEILGAKAAVYLAEELGMKKLLIFYDYLGIAKWVTGEWKAKNKHTKSYVKAIHNVCVRCGLSLTFKKVRSHSGIAGNEEADRLAKEAVGLL